MMTSRAEEPTMSRNAFADPEDVEARGVGLSVDQDDVEEQRGTGVDLPPTNNSHHHHHHHHKKKKKKKSKKNKGDEDEDETNKSSKKRKSLRERAKQLKDDVLEGYQPGTGFLYAFKGIWFFVFNPSLWFVVVCPLACASFFSVLSVVLLLVFALPAQAHGLYNAIETAWFPMWLSWLIAVALTLLESAIVVMLLTQLLFNCYKGMLEERVFRLRGISADSDSTVAVACANVVSQALFAWLVMLVTIPLNLVPIIGNIVFFFLSGTVFAWNLHAGYFGSRDLAFGQQLRFVASHWFDYLSFGFVCLALDMVPIVNFVFIFTNMVGAALWAADLEKSNALEPYLAAQAREMEALDRSRKKLRKQRIEEARRKRRLAKKQRILRRQQRLLESDPSSSEGWTSSSSDLSPSSSSSSSESEDSDDEMPSRRNNRNATTTTTVPTVPTTVTTVVMPPPTTPSTSASSIPTQSSYAPSETTKLTATSPTTTPAASAGGGVGGTSFLSSILPFHRSAPAPPPSTAAESEVQGTTSSGKAFPMMPIPSFSSSPNNNRREYEEIEEVHPPPSDDVSTESRNLLSSPSSSNATTNQY
eukprot:TRINITY_DN386_c0_g3_i1.p1 TRINITY_DN386_c0_g3~~TRINITY_DN386_c0_g3_i1.p1  ORF type:complete len:587 (-),score=146.78 TRINITY_DN386_c0_g3_i1:157-1917(-)